MDDGPNGSMTLCHGIVHGQGPLEGIVFPHAWNEIGEYVLDESNGHDLLIDRQTYYAVGDIDTVYRYDFYEMAEMADRYGTYGPWEAELDFDWRNAKVAFPLPTHKDLEDAARQICVQLGLDQDSVAIIQNIIETILWNNPVMFGKREDMGARIANSGTIEYEDDVVVVLDPDGHEDYKGIFDYCPYKEDVDEGLFRFDPVSKVYKGVDGTIAEGYTMQKIAEEDIRVPDRPDPDGNYGTCPVCESPSFDGTTCTVCGYTEFPEGFGEVDTDSVEDPEISDEEKESDEDEQDTSKDDETSDEDDDDEDIDFDDDDEEDDDDEDDEFDFDDDDDDEDDEDDEEDEDMKKDAQAILDGRQFNLWFECISKYYARCVLTDTIDSLITAELCYPMHSEGWKLYVEDQYENSNLMRLRGYSSLDELMHDAFGWDVQYAVEMYDGSVLTNGTTASTGRKASRRKKADYDDALEMSIEVPMYVTCNVTITQEGEEEFYCYVEPDWFYGDAYCTKHSAQFALEEALAHYDLAGLTKDLEDAYWRAEEWEGSLDPIGEDDEY